VNEMRQSARLVGLDPASVPASEAEIARYYIGVRPNLRVTKLARDSALWLFAPPMPRWMSVATPARPAWITIMSVSAGLLPRWARRMYGLPGLPTTDVSATIALRALRRTIDALPESWTENPYRTAALARCELLAS
jgi:uncharacterized protein (DUF2236 family)